MDDGISDKLFVMLLHRKEEEECIVAKATSKVTPYLYDGRKPWVVWFQPNEVSYFSRLTAIQPDNIFGMSYTVIKESQAVGDFQILGPLPKTFKEKFVGALRASDLVTPKLKKSLLLMLG